MNSPRPNVRLHGLTLGSTFIASRTLRVPIESVESVRLGDGARSRHPWLQATVGLLLLALAAAFWWPQVRWYVEDRTVSPAFLFAAGCFTGLGLWIVFDALRRGSYLEVRYEGRTVRLDLTDRLDTEVRQAVTVALADRYGMQLP